MAGLKELTAIAKGNNIVTRRLSSSPAEGKNVEAAVKSSLVSPRHDLAILFTCKVCDKRSMKTMSRETYEKGVVIARCGGCNSNHLIADNLGLFGKAGNIEDFLAERGISVKTATEDTYEFKLEDFVPRKDAVE